MYSDFFIGGIMKIAIDGPAGSGKSSIAKKIAEILKITYIDTGAMYRAITLKLRHFNRDEYENILKDTIVDIEGDKIYLDGKDVTGEIRSEEISKLTSEFSKIQTIRDYLVKLQREIAEKKSVVMEGRDITTVVLPDAEYKFFLTADEKIRANRRFFQLREKNENLKFENVLLDLKNRDINDSTRENSPLKVAKDAILIDSTNLNEKETIDEILKYVRG